MRDRLEQAYNTLSPDARVSKRRALTLALALSSLKDAHNGEWRQYRATNDHAAWDRWLIGVGCAALELRLDWQARLDCDEGTAHTCCPCQGCLNRRALADGIEGSARGSRGLTRAHTDSECLRQGLELHSLWVYR